MNITKYIKVSHVYCGVSKNTNSRFCMLSGVELALRDTETEVGRPVFSDFLSKQILENWDDLKLLSLARDKTIVAIEIANFKDKENPEKWISVPMRLWICGDFDI